MSIFNFEGSAKTYWNFKNHDKPGYAPQIAGTVVEVAIVPTWEFGKPGVFKCFESGDIKPSLRLCILTEEGELYWEFEPGGIRKPSAARAAVFSAMQKAGLGGDIENLLGKLVVVATQDGNYSVNNPRPWWFEISGEGDASAVRGAVDELTEANEKHKAQMQQPQQVMQSMPQAYMPSQPVAQQQYMQPQPVQLSQPQYQMQQTQQSIASRMGWQQPAQQPQPQQYQQPGIYDQDIPF